MTEPLYRKILRALAYVILVLGVAPIVYVLLIKWTWLVCDCVFERKCW